MTLQGAGLELNAADRAFIRRVAGHHPYLVQATAAALFDAIADGTHGSERYATAARLLQNRTEAHFADLWDHLDDSAQVIMVILALSEIDSQVAGREFDTGALGNLEGYEAKLRRLEQHGLVEVEEQDDWQANWGNFGRWNGRRWRVSAGSFVWWIADNAIAGTRADIDFSAWLRESQHRRLLTREETENLEALAREVPEGVMTDTGTWQSTFLQGFAAAPPRRQGDPPGLPRGG